MENKTVIIKNEFLEVEVAFAIITFSPPRLPFYCYTLGFAPKIL